MQSNVTPHTDQYQLHVIILAAGRGTRMHSELPKVLQPVGGQPMLMHVINAVIPLQPTRIHVVHGHGGDQVKQAFSGQAFDNDLFKWVEQQQQLGTGHAVLQALPGIPETARILVLMGDQPLLNTSTLQQLLKQTSDQSINMLTMRLTNPHGYGRIIRSPEGQIEGIIEQRDATELQSQITEVNSGIYCFPANPLTDWLKQIGHGNAAGELYLTDVVTLAVNDGFVITSHEAENPDELIGANDQSQLADIERIYQCQQVKRLQLKGVRIIDPARFDLRGTLSTGKDVVLDTNVIISGNCELGNNVEIGSGCVISNSRLAAGTKVHAHSVLDGVVTTGPCEIGPFARLRSGTVLASGCKIGNFVETKKAMIDKNTKASHLTYLGDATIGANVNIGAGTITCNYDGVNKHQTVIEDNVFIGSDTQLVAPVTIEQGAFIGAGSTIVKTVPADQLTLSRSQQVSLENWTRPVREKL